MARNKLLTDAAVLAKIGQFVGSYVTVIFMTHGPVENSKEIPLRKLEDMHRRGLGHTVVQYAIPGLLRIPAYAVRKADMPVIA
jgi:hypothetical protein